MTFFLKKKESKNRNQEFDYHEVLYLMILCLISIFLISEKKNTNKFLCHFTYEFFLLEVYYFRNNFDNLK